MVQDALRYICSMFRMYLNLHYLSTYSSGYPIWRHPVHVKLWKKCIYNVSPYLCEYAGLFNSFLRHPWAEKLTCKQTKLFACFGAFDFRNMCFYLKWSLVKVGEKLRLLLLCITQLRIDVDKIWTYLHVHQGKQKLSGCINRIINNRITGRECLSDMGVKYHLCVLP